MAISRGQQTRSSVKLPVIGTGVEVAIIGDRRRPWTDFQTGQVKMGNNGQPRQQLVVTGVVVTQSGANVGSQDAPRSPDVGEVVDAYLHGHVWGSWIDAEKALRTSGLEPQVGDIMLWHYSHDEPSSQGQPKKMRNVSFRRPRPEEKWALDQAEALYYQLGFDKPDVDQGQPDIEPEPFPPSAPTYPQQAPPAYPNQAPPAYPPQAPQPSQAPAYAPQGGAPGQVAQQPAPAQQGGYQPSTGGSDGPGF